ncbi:MAG TPA: pilus assembly protein N-terminal domain-containing protein [Rhizomicrobium sp.]|jgi:hypothetical protein
MNYVVRVALMAACLPIAAHAADAPVCHPAHHHHVAAHHKVASHASGIAVVIDQARVVSFAKPVKTLFVGNPTVVDVNLIDSQHAFLLGKTFGITNLVALQADGSPLSNQQVTVLNNGSAVTVNRGGDQYNYMCSKSHCETAPRPGDPKVYVDNTESSATTHESASMANATASANATPAAN